MEEVEINNALGIHKNETSAQSEKNIPEESYGHEKTLKTIASIVLTCGIIATVVMLPTVAFREQSIAGYTYLTETKIDIEGFLITVLTCISSITIWATLNVLSNISINLFKIKNILKNS